MQIARPVIGQRMMDVIRSVDFLIDRRDVDRNRISVIGRGSIGLVVLHAAAFDERIISVMVDNTLYSYNACLTNPIFKFPFSDFVPGSAAVYDVRDLVACILPRPVSVIRPMNHLNQPADRNNVRMSYYFVEGIAQLLDSRNTFQLIHEEAEYSFEDDVLSWLKSVR